MRLTKRQRAECEKLRVLRVALDVACVEAVAADQDGNQIEHLNQRVLEKAHDLGRALKAQYDAITERMRAGLQARGGGE